MLRTFLTFDSFIFPKITQVIYWIGLVLILLGTLVSLIGALGLAASPYGGGGFMAFFMIIISLVVGAAGLVLWRVMVELWMVQFSIHEVLRQIRDDRRV